VARVHGSRGEDRSRYDARICQGHDELSHGLDFDAGNGGIHMSFLDEVDGDLVLHIVDMIVVGLVDLNGLVEGRFRRGVWAHLVNTVGLVGFLGRSTLRVGRVGGRLGELAADDIAAAPRVRAGAEERIR
jgi:hypothetical protein